MTGSCVIYFFGKNLSFGNFSQGFRWGHRCRSGNDGGIYCRIFRNPDEKFLRQTLVDVQNNLNIQWAAKIFEQFLKNDVHLVIIVSLEKFDENSLEIHEKDLQFIFFEACRIRFEIFELYRTILEFVNKFYQYFFDFFSIFKSFTRKNPETRQKI